jgi:hypothetical protein
VLLDFVRGFLLNDPRRSPRATLLLPGQVRLHPPHCNFSRIARDLPAHRHPARRAAAPPLPAAEPVFARPCRVTPALAHAFQCCSRHLSSGRPALALQRAACRSLPHAPPRRAPPAPVRHRAHARAAPAQRPRLRVHASTPPEPPPAPARAEVLHCHVLRRPRATTVSPAAVAATPPVRALRTPPGACACAEPPSLRSTRASGLAPAAARHLLPRRVRSVSACSSAAWCLPARTVLGPPAPRACHLRPAAAPSRSRAAALAPPTR